MNRLGIYDRCNLVKKQVFWEENGKTEQHYTKISNVKFKLKGYLKISNNPFYINLIFNLNLPCIAAVEQVIYAFDFG